MPGNVVGTGIAYPRQEHRTVEACKVIRYKCDHCNARMESPESMGGQRERCPTCGHPNMVPRPGVAKPNAAQEGLSRETAPLRPDKVGTRGPQTLAAPPRQSPPKSGWGFLQGLIVGVIVGVCATVVAFRSGGSGKAPSPATGLRELAAQQEAADRRRREEERREREKDRREREEDRLRRERKIKQLEDKMWRELMDLSSLYVTMKALQSSGMGGGSSIREQEELGKRDRALDASFDERRKMIFEAYQRRIQALESGSESPAP